MKRIFIVSLMALAALTSCNNMGGGSSDKAEMDSVAYMLGLDLGRIVKQMDSTLNVNKIAEGISDVMKNKAKYTQEEAVQYLTQYFNVRVPLKNLAASQAFLEGVEKSNKNVKKTDSGLLYEIIEQGDMSHAATQNTDTVRVIYKGTLPSGEMFDSSEQFEDGSFRTSLNAVIPGWTEGMKLVGKGGKIKLYIPSDLAYGPQGRSQQIRQNQALVFDVEIVDVMPYVAPVTE